MTVDATDPTAKPTLDAPVIKIGALRWLRENLFNNWFNSILTVICLYLIWLAASGIFEWGYLEATFSAENRRECYNNSEHGACWAGVFEPSNFRKIFYGRYPAEELWRINIGVGIGILWLAPVFFARVQNKTTLGMTMIVFYPFLAAYYFSGGEKGLFMQVMVSLAAAVFVWNTIHALIGFMAEKSLANVLVPMIGLGNASEKTQRYGIAGVILLGAIIAFVVAKRLAIGADYLDKMGRHASDPGDFGDRHCCGAAGRHRAGPGPALEDADYPLFLDHRD